MKTLGSPDRKYIIQCPFQMLPCFDTRSQFGWVRWSCRKRIEYVCI